MHQLHACTYMIYMYIILHVCTIHIPGTTLWYFKNLYTHSLTYQYWYVHIIILYIYILHVELYFLHNMYTCTCMSVKIKFYTCNKCRATK
jgi:hypothetical protein